MIILTAGHTGANSGAQCTETHFDEGAENIWLRNRIAEIFNLDKISTTDIEAGGQHYGR